MNKRAYIRYRYKENTNINYDFTTNSENKDILLYQDIKDDMTRYMLLQKEISDKAMSESQSIIDRLTMNGVILLSPIWDKPVSSTDECLEVIDI